MSKEFIESGINSRFIRKAAEQEDQLAYFTRSEMQETHLSSEYLSTWAERKYQTSDYFLNFVKSVFKTENFLTFFKYLRKPLPSAKLINNRVIPQLRRVFNAENAEFKYIIEGIDEIDYLKILRIKDFEHELFGRMLFSHNSLVVSDIKDKIPYRYFIDVKNVVSIENTEGKVSKIAFKGSLEIDGEIKNGFIYIDDKRYAFFDDKYEEILSSNHRLGSCPVHFINPKVVGDDWVIRESIFTYIREELEEYTFLKTIQKMTDPNGSIPIVTQLDVDVIDDNADIDTDDMELPSNSMSSQKAEVRSNNPPNNESVLQIGSVFKIPVIEKEGGGLDMDAVKNFINFHYIPIESLDYLKGRIEEIENSIVSTLVGGIINGLKEGSKNEIQIEESLSVLQNTLVHFADSFNYIRELSDRDMLRLKYGSRVMEVSIFYGSDFFLDTESMLYANLERANNTIERKNILLRINQNRYKGNENKINRQKILYDLIPYISDSEFEIALDKGNVDNITFEYQTRFNYWISQFEAYYGDIVTFYTNSSLEPHLKMKEINDLILLFINEKSERND